MEQRQDAIKGYKEDYLTLQKKWRKESEELFLVGKLAYWTYWLSYYAANKSEEKREELFAIKRKGMQLLSQSQYTQLRKYIPGFSNKLCYRHYGMMKRKNVNVHHFLNRNQEHLQACENCKKREEHFYTLYSLAVLDQYGENDKRPLFIMYIPYDLMKGIFPALETLESVKVYPQREYGKIRVDRKQNSNLEPVFSIKLIKKKFEQSYKALQNYFEHAENRVRETAN
ncbi:hypothetical protein P4662_29965 [Priestia megaterium]|nr:hypothetical protein [Priestia megaterium]